MAKKDETAAADIDAELANEKPKKSKKAAAEEAAPPKKSKKAAAEDAAPAKKTKKAAEDAAPAKKAKKAAAERAPRGESRTEEVRKVISKVKKPTSYADIAAKGDPEFDIRSVRRTARAMRDAGEAELTKEGRDVFVKGVQ